jgi:hypothetical protein
MVRIITVAGATAVLWIGLACPAAFADSTYDTALRASYCLGFLETDAKMTENMLSRVSPEVQRKVAPEQQTTINLRNRVFGYLLATGFLTTMPSLIAQQQGREDYTAAIVTHTMSIADAASRATPCYSLSWLPY